MNRFVSPVLKFSFCVSILLAAIVAWAAITGSISGIVTDPSGAVVAGVTVVATSISTNVQKTTVTDAAGFYSFPALNVDHYNVAVSQTGYRNFQESGVPINANSAVRIDIKLELGQVTNTVTVKSAQLQVETQSTQMGDVIQGAKITSVPLNGRSFIDLLALQPGVSPYQGDSTTGGLGAATPGLQSINGGRLGSNGFMINGADSEDPVHNGAEIVPNLDSIAQFRIITNNFNAEYGNYSGGQINVVTKSGTNGYHGDAFEFLRNTDLDAKNYFSTNRGQFKQNQFGGTLGGPIRKDKIFWFGDFQGTKQIIGESYTDLVPSVADRSGNFLGDTTAVKDLEGSAGVTGAYWAGLLSQRLGYLVTDGEPYYKAGCVSTSTCVFPNAVIPSSATDPVAVNTLKYIPMPNGTLGGQPVYQTSAFNNTLTDYKGGLRLDVNTRYGGLFGYYYQDHQVSAVPYPYNVPNTSASATDSTVNTKMFNLGLTTTINTSLLNDVRLVYLRAVSFLGFPVGGFVGPSLSSLGFNSPWNSTGGIGNVDPSLVGVPRFTFNNYSFGLPASTLKQYNNTVQIIDNVTKIVGTHSIQFGVDTHYDQVNERNSYAPNGAFSFNGNETGFDFADFLLGAPNSLTQASKQVLDSRSIYYGVYAQDSWRALPTLTVNYGLRWDVSTPWYDTQNKLETLIQGEQSLSFPGAPKGLLVPLDPGVPRTLSPIKYTNFAPRIGLAYSPDVEEGLLAKILGGPGKTSIRTGFGIFYSSIEDATGFIEVGDAPYGNFYGSPAPPLLDSPYIDRATGHNEGIKFPFLFPPTNVSPKNPDTTFDWAQQLPISGSDYFSPKNVLPYTEEFELSLQRQLGSATVLSASYVGTVGRHLFTFVEANPGDPALCLALSNPANLAPNSHKCGPNQEQSVFTMANGQVVNSTRTAFGPAFGSDLFMKTSASSSYNSLQASLQHTEKYLNFLIGYTYSKSIDNGSDTFDATNPFNPALSRALSSYDVPQNLVASYTVQLPFNNFLGNGSVARRFTAGWALSGVSTFASGQPVKISENDDHSLIGSNSYSVDEPNYANNGSPLFLNRNPRSQQKYFNPAYFTKENIGQFGNVMRRFFHGPGIDNSNVALLKNTQITGTTELQFRAEAFNVFNHAQFNNPVGNINNTNAFGRVTSAQSPRIMQIALKLLF